jgi:hypothetical protein
VTQKYYDRYPDIASKPLRIHSAMISALDDGVGALEAELKTDGLDQDARRPRHTHQGYYTIHVGGSPAYRRQFLAPHGKFRMPKAGDLPLLRGRDRHGLGHGP